MASLQNLERIFQAVHDPVAQTLATSSVGGGADDTSSLASTERIVQDVHDDVAQTLRTKSV